MVFSTPLFVFAFLPAVLFFYFLAPVRFRNHVALAFSFAFYAFGAPKFIAVVFVSCLFDWLITARIHRATDTVRRKHLLILGVASNLLLLGHFKYTDFALGSLNSIFAMLGLEPIPLLGIALPIGISFITFEKITYIVDVYRGEGHPARSFVTYLLYIHYFPQLIAGPIIKYHDIEDQFDSRPYTLDGAVQGLSRFAVGLAKKVLLADALAPTVEAAFALPPSELDPATAWLGIVCYTLQLYFDFSGYSDMAIGTARAMGFRFQENFNMPYISMNLTEFWRRWHISLSTWIRSYLYFPLGGNRVSTWRTYANLWLCFVLCGLWHGAAWNYVIYGTYQGIFMVLDKIFWIDLQARLPRFFNIGLTFLITMFGFVIFRTSTMGEAGDYFVALLSFRSDLPRAILATPEILAYVSVGLMLSFFPATRFFEPLMERLERLSFRDELFTATAILLFVLSMGRIAGESFSPFLYFRF